MLFSKFFLFTLILLVVGTFGQIFEDKTIIDPFSVNTETFLITTPDSDSFNPITESRSTTTQTVIGGERDIQLTALSGANRVFSTSVTSDEWNVNTPTNANGFAFLQYDGLDGTTSLDENGLGGANFLSNSGFGFRIELTVDIDTILSILIYSGGDECSLDIDIDGEPEVLQEFFVEFDDFSGNCNFGSVGALEVLVEAFDQVDIAIRTFVVFGEVVVNPSPTRTPTRTPQGRPSIDISLPSVPEPSVPDPEEPSEPEPNNCFCDCPDFRCGLVYKVPGDDDDTIDDDIHDDDDLIYRPVYYGYEPVDDDFEYILGDDDEHELISRERGLTINHSDDDDESTGAASVISASFALIVVVFVSMI